jgi:hypothetical protein
MKLVRQVSSLYGDRRYGVVDAAYYVTWRKGLGATYAPPEYNTWRTHFGKTAGSSANIWTVESIPEPATFSLALLAAAALLSESLGTFDVELCTRRRVFLAEAKNASPTPFAAWTSASPASNNRTSCVTF